MTIKQALLEAKNLLKHVSDIPQKEASILLSYAIGLTQAELITKENYEFDEKTFFELVARRAEFEPVEYITKKANFYSLEFYVSPNCLIPRPETEILVEKVLNQTVNKKEVTIADICSGSGAIVVTLAKYLPNATFFASDISAEALEIAKHNAAKHNVSEKIKFYTDDLAQNLPPCDIIISNPPYIADSYKLPNPVKYEPSLALLGGVDGSDLLKRLIIQFHKHSAKTLFCEFGYDQREIVQNFCQNLSFKSLDFYQDYAGLTRGFIIKK